MDFLNQHTSGLILLQLAQHGPCSTNDLMKITKKARSTIFWHVKRLRDSQLIKSRYTEFSKISQDRNPNRSRLFHSSIHDLINREFIIGVITKYRYQFNY